MPPKVYFTHDNGARPFRVVIDRGSVDIYINKNAHNTPILSVVPIKIFVGKSPRNKMTTITRAFGKEYDGNSILLHLKGLQYMFIGDQIYTFKAKAPIEKYLSPVGNNDVPYPYAIDREGNFYLMIENVVIHNRGEVNIADILHEYDDDPYAFYYRLHLITPDITFHPPKQPIDENARVVTRPYKGIIGYLIDNDPYRFSYSPNPAVDHDRLMADLGNKMYLVKSDAKGNIRKTALTKRSYVNLMRDLGEERGLSPIPDKKVIQKRMV